MKKVTFLPKALYAAFFLFAGNTVIAQAELRVLTEGSTRFNQINDDGYGVTTNHYYDFATNELTYVEPEVYSVVSINNDKNVLGSVFYDEPEFILQPAYRKDNVWKNIEFLPEQNPMEDAFNPYKISPNNKYIVGQLSIDWIYSGFVFDTDTEELTAAFDPQGESGAFYGVNDNGIAVGWVDRPNQFGTLRVPAYRTLDGEITFIPEAQLPEESQVNAIFDINSSDVMVGDFDLRPFIYDKPTNTFTLFENPGGAFEGAFSGISENGIAVGFAEVDFQVRDAIIYHPSLGDQPVFLKDLLIEHGIAINTPDGLLGTAISVSPNGKYIVGWLNGPPMFAEGWILNVDDLLLGTEKVVKNEVSVYPNPVENILHIRATEKVNAIKIVNVLGQEITNVVIDATNQQIDVSDLANGVYMIKIISNGNHETFKIIKQ